MPKVSDDHIRVKRQQILDGARRCFAEYGFEGATVRRLEATTELSRGAIFHHFKDKESLFLALADEDAEAMAETIAHAGVVQVMRDILADPDRFTWLATRLEIGRRLRTDENFRAAWSSRQQEIDAAIRERLQQRKSDGLIRADIDDHVLVNYFDVVLDGLINYLVSGRSTEHLSAMLDLVESSVRVSK